MSTQPTRKALLGLYGVTLRTARSFKSYNFRNYFLQRTKDNFRTLLASTRFLECISPQTDKNRVSV
ncbi:hypothetical protein EDD16DRAFT_1548643 [Pisolithus croceorrhizus]|nr:hypothetical protein EDD16DRAFT_1548643 [Pisolithus croceorrhizus]